MSVRVPRARRDRMLRERRHDPYRAEAKRSEPLACPECSAVYRNGRWQWLPVPFEAARELCPACRRALDGYPAGEVALSGPFFEERQDEILALARHTAERQNASHPLQSIMAEEQTGETVVLSCTDLHLARAIGDAIRRAYGGELAYHYPEEAALLRVSWHR